MRSDQTMVNVPFAFADNEKYQFGFLSQWKSPVSFIVVSFSNSVLLCNGLNMAENEALWILQFSDNIWGMRCHFKLNHD